jgi:hypothetical protein
MDALLSVLIVLPMSINLFNFDEVTITPEHPAEAVVIEEETTEPELSFEEMNVDQRAASVNLTTQEFIAISNIVERESNRCIPQTEEDLQGRIMIALVVFNRASERHPEFGNDIISVITQRGQFSTSRRSRDVNQSTYRTEYSDRAVYEAYQWIQSGEEYPDVLFFNCRYFFRWRPQYQLVGGNYFSL